MLLSLVGIIWIQTSWIGDAIAEQEQDFKVRVNEALNTVNDSIDTEEAELFIEEQFGGLDSLVDQFILMDQPDSNTIVQINVEEGSDKMKTHGEMTFIHSIGENPQDGMMLMQDSLLTNSVLVVNDSASDGIVIANDFDTASYQQINWSSEFSETHINDDDTSNALREFIVGRSDRVRTIVKRYTFESLMNGELESRIQPEDLKDKIGKALKKEGVPGAFSFAVKNDKTGAFEEKYRSKNYDSTATNSAFAKPLFQSDRSNRMQYTLYVQPEDSSSFVWSKVWKMTVLSIVFTILILVSFGYALYFIFKQKKVSQIKNDFINNMTHELKTPLASISIATASIDHPEIINNPEEIRRLTQVIQDEKDRINSHVERVLDTAALDSGELKLSTEQMNIAEVLRCAAKNIELSLLHVNGSISISGETNVSMEGDAFHLTNVFTNILDNSIKYRSEEAPKIFVEVQSDSSRISISISDNGIGMTSKQQKQAFEKFYRAETGDIHNRKGFGLGLSYVQSVVEKHQGSVGIKSKVNEGTTVTIQFRKV